MAFHRKKSTIWLTAAAAALALVAGTAVVVAAGSDQGTALADAPDKKFFVDITKVKPNVKKPQAQQNATKGTFTVDCGVNENGHFNPDNFIAQPGVKNGAQHLHDYVGNLSTNADSNNKSLQKAGTTCKNGDKSAYFWPVVRIEDPKEAAERDQKDADKQQEKQQNDKKKQQREQQQQKDQADKAAARVDCPDVNGKLEADEVPDKAKAEIDKELENLDKQIDEANQALDQGKGKNNPDEVLGPLRDKRAAALNRMMVAINRQNVQPPDLNPLAQCKLKKGQDAGVDNGDENSDKAQAEGTEDKANKDNKAEQGADNELEGNEGEIQRPEKAELTFRGSPVGKVVAMPKFLRILYGDAKVGQNGPKNAKDSWTCSGFEDKVLINKYPICPKGSKVKRIHDFPSCWDGKNIDSAKHREHIIYPDANGKCKKGFKAVPQLRITLTYNIPQDVQKAGLYAVDSFPEEEHNPFSDHDDFANVMSQSIMNRVVNCINTGKTCKE
ncbi:hypothetical protein Lesp02_81810 [Lentzea sp. NBRC 105346]|uniref:DUF1996 domain-containing protein n=1 Tax=Lentzea sp. NBRC 105346 TaxID=3032205 RepID=UPI0024A5DE43|nr:DUF1996 domain-containing protein [Lentzea sp. NBRC 105346]GLZ35994.1 hypothetical protein Lesp02_81810 [Lentzea sp. NBRC 105346]